MKARNPNTRLHRTAYIDNTFSELQEGTLSKDEIINSKKLYRGNGCNVYLMATDKEIKESDQTHLYLYKDEKEKKYFYVQNNTKTFLELKDNNELLEQASFDQPATNPIRCRDEELINQVINITFQKHHTLNSKEYYQNIRNKRRGKLKSVVMVEKEVDGEKRKPFTVTGVGINLSNNSEHDLKKYISNNELNKILIINDLKKIYYNMMLAAKTHGAKGFVCPLLSSKYYAGKYENQMSVYSKEAYEAAKKEFNVNFPNLQIELETRDSVDKAKLMKEKLQCKISEIAIGIAGADNSGTGNLLSGNSVLPQEESVRKRLGGAFANPNSYEKIDKILEINDILKKDIDIKKEKKPSQQNLSSTARLRTQTTSSKKPEAKPAQLLQEEREKQDPASPSHKAESSHESKIDTLEENIPGIASFFDFKRIEGQIQAHDFELNEIYSQLAEAKTKAEILDILTKNFGDLNKEYKDIIKKLDVTVIKGQAKAQIFLNDPQIQNIPILDAIFKNETARKKLSKHLEKDENSIDINDLLVKIAQKNNLAELTELFDKEIIFKDIFTNANNVIKSEDKAKELIGYARVQVVIHDELTQGMSLLNEICKDENKHRLISEYFAKQTSFATLTSLIKNLMSATSANDLNSIFNSPALFNQEKDKELIKYIKSQATGIFLYKKFLHNTEVNEQTELLKIITDYEIKRTLINAFKTQNYSGFFKSLTTIKNSDDLKKVFNEFHVTIPDKLLTEVKPELIGGQASYAFFHHYLNSHHMESLANIIADESVKHTLIEKFSTSYQLNVETFIEQLAKRSTNDEAIKYLKGELNIQLGADNNLNRIRAEARLKEEILNQISPKSHFYDMVNLASKNLIDKLEEATFKLDILKIRDEISNAKNIEDIKKIIKLNFNLTDDQIQILNIKSLQIEAQYEVFLETNKALINKYLYSEINNPNNRNPIVSHFVSINSDPREITKDDIETINRIDKAHNIHYIKEFKKTFGIVLPKDVINTMRGNERYNNFIKDLDPNPEFKALMQLKEVKEGLVKHWGIYNNKPDKKIIEKIQKILMDVSLDNSQMAKRISKILVDSNDLNNVILTTLKNKQNNLITLRGKIGFSLLSQSVKNKELQSLLKKHEDIVKEKMSQGGLALIENLNKANNQDSLEKALLNLGLKEPSSSLVRALLADNRQKKYKDSEKFELKDEQIAQINRNFDKGTYIHYLEVIKDKVKSISESLDKNGIAKLKRIDQSLNQMICDLIAYKEKLVKLSNEEDSGLDQNQQIRLTNYIDLISKTIDDAKKILNEEINPFLSDQKKIGERIAVGSPSTDASKSNLYPYKSIYEGSDYNKAKQELTNAKTSTSTPSISSNQPISTKKEDNINAFKVSIPTGIMNEIIQIDVVRIIDQKKVEMFISDADKEKFSQNRIKDSSFFSSTFIPGQAPLNLAYYLIPLLISIAPDPSYPINLNNFNTLPKDCIKSFAIYCKFKGYHCVPNYPVSKSEEKLFKKTWATLHPEDKDINESKKLIHKVEKMHENNRIKL